jgi:HEAT repeat protein
VVTPVTLILVLAALMSAIGLLAILAWFFYTAYLNRVERRLAARKSLYRDLVSELATRDRALLEPTIHQMKTLYDLDALEALLEEQARSSTERPAWLLEVYDELGLMDKYIDKLRTARKWRDRAFAAELLGRVGSAKAVPALLETIQATRTEDSDVREIALRALARIADPRAVGPLVGTLSSADTWLSARIADILTRHGDAAVEPAIELLSGTAGHPARAWAANVLGEIRAQRAFPALIRGLSDSDEEVRGKSATALGRLGDRRAISHLLDHLLTDPAPFVRARVASTLGQFGGPEVIERLVRALHDPAWWVRMRSVEALEQTGPMAEGPLLVALNDSDADIRSRAATALERLGVPGNLAKLVESSHESGEAAHTLVRLSAGGARELLVELLQHRSMKVRRAGITAIRSGHRTDLIPELMQSASADSDPVLRTLSFQALQALRATEATPVALESLADTDPGVRAAANDLIGELGTADSVELLRERTRDAEAQVRAAAARALGAMHATGAGEDFHRLLVDPVPLVREAALNSAGEARLGSLAPAILELLHDPSVNVQRAAAAALASLGEPKTVPALVHAFADAPTDVRVAIVAAIARLDLGATPPLIDALLRSTDPEARVAVARLLSRFRSPGALNVLTHIGQSPDPTVRSAGIEALGRRVHCTDEEAEARLNAVTAALEDADEQVRRRAIDAAARLGFSDQSRSLPRLLTSDPSPQVRERAALAIGILRLSGCEGPLSAACRRTEPVNIRAAAALALGAVDPTSMAVRVLEMPGEEAVRDFLRQRLTTDPWFRLLRRRLSPARALELRSLAAANPAEAQLQLAEGLRSVLNPGERVQMIGSLRAFHGEPGLTALLRLVREDPNPEVRTSALLSVRDLLDTEETLAVGARSLGDPDLLVRRAAVDLLSRATPERAFATLIRTIKPDEDASVLASVAEFASENFLAFRDAAATMPLAQDQLILLARISQFIHHPELSRLLLPLSQNSSPDVREAVALVSQHRPDAIDSAALAALTADPAVSVRQVATGAAAAAQRYDLLEKLLHDPDARIRRQIAIELGRSAPIRKAGFRILERLGGDGDMPVRAAAYVARLLQGLPVPFPPGIEPQTAAEAVRDASDLSSLRQTARDTPGEDRRLAAALALALLQDEVAHEVARTDPTPAIRHRVSGALELGLPASREPAP